MKVRLGVVALVLALLALGIGLATQGTPAASALAVTGSGGEAAGPADPGNADDPSSVITAEDMYNRIYFLASNALQGRDTPSPGLEAAAAYLVSEHRKMGLEPGNDGSFYQRWPYRLMGPDLEAASIVLTGPGGERSLVVGQDIALRGGTDGSVEGPLVMVGGCNEIPEEGSLSGKIAVFCLPVEGEWSRQAQALALRQAAFAESAGALATVHLLGADLTSQAMAQITEAMSSPTRLMGEDTPGPQIFLNRDTAGEIEPRLPVDIVGLSHGEMEELESRLAAEFPIRIHDDARPPNVVAMIPGSDPQLRDEYVVLSAHFDHVGVGTPMDGDSIYNGADDNASGTAALLETARAISAMPEAPRRSVVFTHVSGEEKGLLGAEWFVDHPPVPVSQMVANLNADMIGSDTHRDTLVVIGKDYSTLGPLVDRINEANPGLGLVTSDDLWPEQRFFYRSDQYHFMRVEVPSLFFFTGVHECYHRPCDVPGFVDPDKAARIARLLTLSVLEIANADERPEWDAAGLAEVRELTGAGR